MKKGGDKGAATAGARGHVKGREAPQPPGIFRESRTAGNYKYSQGKPSRAIFPRPEFKSVLVQVEKLVKPNTGTTKNSIWAENA